MKKMKKVRIIIMLLATMFFTLELSAQQDAQYTQWQWNKLSFNPAYAGSTDNLSLTILGRSQWVGLEGAPKTGSISLHAPFKSKRVNLGLHGYWDELGVEQKTGLTLSYAYGFPLNVGHLHLGLNAGFEVYSADFSSLLTG